MQARADTCGRYRDLSNSVSGHYRDCDPWRPHIEEATDECSRNVLGHDVQIGDSA